MATTPTFINQRINNLQAQINSIISGGGGGVPTSSDLAVVLGNGNTAGVNAIIMNTNNIDNVEIITSLTDITLDATMGVIVNPLNQFDLNAGGEITFDTNGGSIQSTCNNNFVVLAGSSVDIEGTAGLVDITAGTDISLTAGAGIGTISLDGANVNSFGYANPICFTRQRTDAFSYSLAGQIFEMVYQTSCQIPQNFVSNAPLPSYTSSIWKIEFALNCFNFSNPTDKGIGIYIDFIDTATNVYTPIIYNATTPYSADQKNFGYSSGAGNPYFSFNYTDYVDFALLYNTATANFPLDVRINFAGDAVLTSNFNMVVSLTRTNLI